MSTERATRPAPTTASATAGQWLAGLVLIGVTAAAAVALTRVTGRLPHLLPGYAHWQRQAYTRIPQFLRWWIGDTTEAEFFKTALGGLGMLAGGWVAHVAWRRGRRRAGFPVAYGTGLWPWLAGSALLGLLLSDAAWGWTLPASGAWQPTFVPFVSVPPAIVLIYGAGWTVAATGAALGATLTTPVALLVVNCFCLPLHLPTVIGNVTGMWVGALIAFALCRHLPWMPPTLAARSTPAPDSPDVPAASPPDQGPGWVVRRVLADFTEAQFYATNSPRSAWSAAPY
ncbi:hypothetical protein OG417_10300 [Actinoallomurus sp. NBC_01490]|uniref:hypothetical protein n=1 Tax=Actinoallomurus sp. NBC_01490 TaxID=2903557 RepID=UPI002E334EC4|nr:hypothetical protein [Actinoallomurus sp. NBC_01490]